MKFLALLIVAALALPLSLNLFCNHPQEKTRQTSMDWAALEQTLLTTMMKKRAQGTDTTGIPLAFMAFSPDTFYVVHSGDTIATIVGGNQP